jgi:hypothetical protein
MKKTIFLIRMKGAKGMNKEDKVKKDEEIVYNADVYRFE